MFHCTNGKLAVGDKLSHTKELSYGFEGSYGCLAATVGSARYWAAMFTADRKGVQTIYEIELPDDAVVADIRDGYLFECGMRLANERGWILPAKDVDVSQQRDCDSEVCFFKPTEAIVVGVSPWDPVGKWDLYNRNRGFTSGAAWFERN